MEKHREEFMLIIAGYPNEIEKLLDVNIGLRSRFTHTINFEDYSPDEMLEIFQVFLDGAGYKLENGVRNTLSVIFKSMIVNTNDFGNARDVRKIFRQICTNMDKRIADDLSITDSYELNLIKQEDLLNLKF
jgi:hypothetical protein